MDNTVSIRLNQLPNVSAVGEYLVKEPWMHRYRQVSINTLIFVQEGTLYVREDGYSYSVPKNHILFFKANATQEGYRSIDKGAKWFWVNFEAVSHIESMQIEPEVLYTLPKTLPLTKHNEIHMQLMRMVELFLSHRPLKQEQMNAILYGVLLDIVEDHHEQESSAQSKLISSKVIDLLKTHIYKSFDAKEIGLSLDMNYNYICRKFKQETGYTMKHYFLTLKVNEAIRLFQATSKNISEISDELNFVNPYYFSRVFKQIKGVSPNNYRKQMYLE